MHRRCALRSTRLRPLDHPGQSSADVARAADRAAGQGRRGRPADLQLGGALPNAFDLDSHVNANGLSAFVDGSVEVQDAYASQAVAPELGRAAGRRRIDRRRPALARGARRWRSARCSGNRGASSRYDVAEPKLIELKERASSLALGSPTSKTRLVRRQRRRWPSGGSRRARRSRARRRAMLWPRCAASPSRDALALDARRARRATRAATTDLGAIRGAVSSRRPRHLRDLHRRAQRERRRRRQLLGRPSRFRASLSPHHFGRARVHAWGDGDRLRLWPHRHGSDGFFAAAIERLR